MAENGRKDVFRARSGEKPTGHRERERKKGMEMEEEERRSVSPTLQSESSQPWQRAQKMGPRGKGRGHYL